MKFLLDQNLSPLTTTFLRGLSYDVVDIREIGMYGAPDSEIARAAKEHNRIVITFDSDFADILELPVGSHPGVIRLKIIPQTIEILHPILERELASLTSQKIEGCLVIIDNKKVRIKRSS